MHGDKHLDFVPRGIIPPIVTPLQDNMGIDVAALRKLIDRLIDGGVHGIFIAGSTGEFYGLSMEEKERLFAVAVQHVAGRVPVYAGTGAITTTEAVQLTRLAEQNHVDAVSVLTPMFISPSQHELQQHYRHVAEATSLPVILYNNQKDFHVLAGKDTLIYACLCHGGTGAIAATANVAPHLVAEIYDRYVAGDLQGSLEAQYRLAPLRMAFSLGSFPAVIKESLQLLGIRVGPCMEPIARMGEKDRQRLRDILREMKLL
jgi:4-hydroxy-tetrahydrodipicolinate synthase